jgi:hypothetical protein
MSLNQHSVKVAAVAVLVSRDLQNSPQEFRE